MAVVFMKTCCFINWITVVKGWDENMSFQPKVSGQGEKVAILKIEECCLLSRENFLPNPSAIKVGVTFLILSSWYHCIWMLKHWHCWTFEILILLNIIDDQSSTNCVHHPTPSKTTRNIEQKLVKLDTSEITSYKNLNKNLLPYLLLYVVAGVSLQFCSSCTRGKKYKLKKFSQHSNYEYLVSSC